MRKFSLREVVTCPKVILANLDMTPHWFRCPCSHVGYHCWKEGCVLTEEILMCSEFTVGSEWRTLSKNDMDQL